MLFYSLTLLNLFFWINYFSKRLKSFFNPVSLYATALFISVISVYFSDIFGLLRQSTISDSFIVLSVYNLSIFVFVTPWLKFKEANYSLKNFMVKEYKLLKITYFLVLIFLSITLLAYFLLGGIPIIDMLSGALNIVEYNDVIKNLPMGMLSIFLLTSTLLSLFVSSFIINQKRLNYNLYFLIILILLTIVSTIWQGKRQGILMLFFFIISRYFQNTLKFTTKISFKKKIYFSFLLILFVASFMQIGKIRHNESSVDNGELLGYSMFPVMNFSYTIMYTSIYGRTVIPNAILSDIFPRRISENNQDSQDIIQTFEPTSPSGYLNPWYYDYGIIGVIIGTFLLSYSSKIFYKKRIISENSMRKNILMLWCCATAGVYNHFITLNYFLVPMLFLGVIDLVNKSVKNDNF